MPLQSWARRLLVSSAATQGAIYVIRPMITYRALEIHAGPSVIGLIAAMYALFPVLLALTFGKMVARTGEGKFIIVGTIAIGASAALLLAAHNVALLIVAAALSGTAHLACMVGGQTMVALKSPEDQYERYFGLYTFSASLGQMIGPILATLVAGTTGVIPESTSRAFALALFVSALALAPALRWRGDAPSVAPIESDSGTLKAAYVLMKKPGIFAAIFTSLAVSSTSDVLVVFLPLYGNEHHFSSFSIGLIIALRAAASMTSRFFLEKISARFNSMTLLSTSNLIAIGGCIAMAFAPTPFILGVIVFITGFVLGIGQPLTMTFVSQRTEPHERALAVSARLTGNRLGQFIVPGVAGVVASSSGTSAVFISLALLLGSTYLPRQR